MIGGDITGKTMTPMVRRAGGYFEALLNGNVLRVKKGGDQLTQLQNDISNTGSYPIRLEPEEYNEMDNNQLKKDERFLIEMKERLKQWLALAELKLKPRGIRLLMICGNDDSYELNQVLDHSSFAENPEKTISVVGDVHEVIGESGANKTPFPRK